MTTPSLMQTWIRFRRISTSSSWTFKAHLDVREQPVIVDLKEDSNAWALITS